MKKVVHAVNSNARMDARDHFKNGASSKSLMSRRNNKLKIMLKTKSFFVTIACITILFCASCASVSFKSQVNSPNDTEQIIGVWKVNQAYGEMIKIITESHFVWTWTLNNIIIASSGGTYTFDGVTYTEYIEFGTQNQSSLNGKKAVVKVRFDGKMLFATGLLDENRPLNEVWERIE